MLDFAPSLLLAIDWPAAITGLLVVAFLFICVVLILTVLIQRPQGGGLSGAFGSAAGTSQSAFGAKTGDVLTIFTIGIFLLFLFAAVGLNWRIAPPAPTAPAVAPLDDEEDAPADSQQPTPAEQEGAGEPAELDPLEIPPPPPDEATEQGQPTPAPGEATGEQEQDPPQTDGQAPPPAEGEEDQPQQPAPDEPAQSDPPAPTGEDPPAGGVAGEEEEPPADEGSQGSDG